MTLTRSTYKPRITYGAGYLSFVDLPTGGLQWQETFTYELEQSVPPGATGSVITGYRKGPTTVVIEGEIQEDDPEAVETVLRAIETAIAYGSFRLFTHHDSTNSVYRYYQDCYATRFVNDLRAGDPCRPGRNTVYELHVIATDPTVYGATPSTDSNEFHGDVSFYPGTTGMVRIFNPDNETVAQFEPLTGDLKIAGFVHEQYLFE